ncbi:MAG: ATP-binding cassette domain-containing protein [Mailhella sp.]|nr:ATP-binding cassette domain-containing protein [Mailhella sp.]
MRTCLSIRGLAVRREKNGSRFTLAVPSLDVRRGEMLAVLGPSGCGKSTLLDVLALILRPTEAERFVLCDGDGETDLFRASEGALAALRGGRIGYVLQSGGLLSFLSVRDNILLPGRLLGRSDADLLPVLDYLAGRLGIEGQLAKKPGSLSGGQRQRVAIARAVIGTPPLVFADEPTAAVDQETAHEICDVFRSVAKELDTALVVVSHDRPLMKRFCDRVLSFEVCRHSACDVESRTFEAVREDV